MDDWRKFNGGFPYSRKEFLRDTAVLFGDIDDPLGIRAAEDKRIVEELVK